MTRKREEGSTLLETLIAATIAGVAFVGTMGAVEVAARFVRQADLVTQAQAVAQSRLEAKRAVGWKFLLEDDVDRDGVPDTVMRDDGQDPDMAAGDGVYSAMAEHRGLTEVWTIEGHRSGPLASVGMVTIRSIVTFEGWKGRRELRMETMRANPAFVGRAQW
ncbi:MAG: type II secretion system GspH family protein [Nitrospira sp.]|nr:type II secretion system GspH family protein [Nitrospira sp.]